MSYPPSSLTSEPSSALGESGHTCFSARHLKPVRTLAPPSPSSATGRAIIMRSYKGGSKPATWELVSKIHFNDGSCTIKDHACMVESVRRGFDITEDPDLDDFVVGKVSRRNLTSMGLWPEYKDVYRTANGVELGVFDDSGEFVNVFEEDPVFEVEESMTGETFDAAYVEFVQQTKWKADVAKTYLERRVETDAGIISIQEEE
ncbi:hypothetical protein L198_07902 [Cryptococcus wingfieldii CBS 7118]|uniref:Uncharacterized protein n=1 Tax=Cryptococcus wingfieldii CBS 7118 TaxID=1295528 RepID=A0A1E3HS65_9TREE|nr:hypothetical protein L198_07902 [Cryptococcus wingfieldii CBS 7118]ODN79152.1 hypothetical protein L198_07902 [Cryptococcus wingfieldii CBS 7118]